MLFKARDHYYKAEALFQRSLAIREQALGGKHPDIAASLHNLANLYYERGQYDEAESLYQRALEIYEQVLIDKHPTTMKVRQEYTDLLKQKDQNPE